MSEQRNRGSRIVSIAGWLARPMVFALRPGYRSAREGIDGLRNLPTKEIPNTEDFVGHDENRSNLNEELKRLEPVRIRSRTFGRLFGVLLACDLIWWSHSVFVAGLNLFSPASIEKIAIATVLGSQFLIFSLTNWQARTGQKRSIQEMLSDARDLWPR